jgi:hypothetical protein
VQRILEGCDRWGEGRGIFYFEASVVQLKDIRPWRPVFGPVGNHFVFGIFLYFGGCSEAAMGGGVRSALFGVLMSPKRRVRAAHGRARAAKTH